MRERLTYSLVMNTLAADKKLGAWRTLPLDSNERISFYGWRVAHPLTPLKRPHRFLRVPDPSVFEGSGFRRGVAPEFL